MFIEHAKRGYDRDGQQKASGTFLMLMSLDPYDKDTPPELKNEFRGLVLPKVHLHQLGHFMMGAFVFRQFDPPVRVPLSGSYGGDGLTRTVPLCVFELGTKLPDELREAWNKGGGWNSAGSEAEPMAEWALKSCNRVNAYGRLLPTKEKNHG